jgi:Fe-S-cluster-containing hydrogenase component 2
MIWAEVDWSICQACEPCQARWACKIRAIVKFDADEMAFIDSRRCRGCGDCVPACSFAAIHVISNQNPSTRLK